MYLIDKQKMAIIIDERNIGVDYPPFIIAEMSGNHDQSLEKVLRIIEVEPMTEIHMKNSTYVA